MKKNRPGLPPDLRIEPLDRRAAQMLQAICTWLGFARSCPYGACRRAGRCATREVICWQTLREPLRPLILWVIAKQWQMAVERGEDPDVAPVNVAMYRQLAQRDFKDIEAEVMQRLDRFEAGQPVDGANEDWEETIAKASEAWTAPGEGVPGCAEIHGASESQS
ncbi:MAG TPA: hypothetical protein VFB16_02050 [Bauldia sp.]|nr:hypothetical protein [Bauldia sp.]